MELGISLPHRGAHATPEAIRDVAQAAEELGFGGVWTVDHVAPVRDASSMYDLGPQPRAISGEEFARNIAPLFDCITTMTYVAAVTSRIHIGSAVLVLPLRNPIYNARQLASLDVLSGGRLLLGVGAGWLAEEAEAMGMPWDQRGARTDEHIEVLRAHWRSSGTFVSHEGPYYSFPELNPEPRPTGPLPILVGGHSTAAKRRAARLGDGWISHRLPPELHRAGIEEVRELARRHGQDADRLRFAGSVDAPSDLADDEAFSKLRARALEYTETDTEHLVLNGAYLSIEAQLGVMQRVATELIPELSGS